MTFSQIKKYWILGALGLLGVGIVLASVLTSTPTVGVATVTEQSIIDQIATEQDAYFLANGKYKQYLTYTQGKYDIKVDEYVGPQGSGYQVVIKKRNTEGKIIREISKGVGILKTTRDFERDITPQIATST